MMLPSVFDFASQFEHNRSALLNELARGIEEALVPFQIALDGFLAGLSRDELPSNWREEWEAFVIEQQTQGFTVDPTSVEEMKTWIESWAKEFDLWPEEREVPDIRLPPKKEPRGRFANQVLSPTAQAYRDFNVQLDAAEYYLSEIERVLNELGRRLDAAELDEPTDVELEVDTIEELIWRFNDARESAVDSWLIGDQPVAKLQRLFEMWTPLRFGLPAFTDDDQEARAVRQGYLIAERQAGRDRTMGRVIAAARTVEAVGMAAGIVVAGTVVVSAYYAGGKWAVVKTLAVGVTALAAEQGAERGLQAAGAPEEVIRGFRLAAVVVAMILYKRRYGAASSAKAPAPTKSPSTVPPKPAPPIVSRLPPLKRAVRVPGSRPKSPSPYYPRRYSRPASKPGAYWKSDRRVFPTKRNSGLSGRALRQEQEDFFLRGLKQGKGADVLRGQAAEAGYIRYGGITKSGGPDRLADRGAENALQRAIAKAFSTK